MLKTDELYLTTGRLVKSSVTNEYEYQLDDILEKLGEKMNYTDVLKKLRKMSALIVRLVIYVMDMAVRDKSLGLELKVEVMGR